MIHFLIRSLIVSASILQVCAAETRGTQATDRASNYSTARTGAEAWKNNTNRADMLFGIWELSSTPNGGKARHFIGDSSLSGGDINSEGRSFALQAHPALNPAPTAWAIRKFAHPTLRTGDSLSFRVSVNLRNGSKGFSLRNPAGEDLWSFLVGCDDKGREGYHIQNGPPGTSFASGEPLGSYDANSIFHFVFTQNPRRLNWAVRREGGIASSLQGSLPVDSGTVADVRFFVAGTVSGETEEERAANTLYFNEITFSSEPRGDAPLTIGERRYPGLKPSPILRFQDEVAGSVGLRTSADKFATSHPLVKNPEGVWEIDIRPLGLAPGHHRFKFDLDGNPESGENRHLFLDSSGCLAKPRAVYLEWIDDPTTTMLVNWHNHDPNGKNLRYRRAGGEVEWISSTASTRPFPFTGRLVHRVDIKGLEPATEYEFQVDGYEETFRFRTMPKTLVRPFVFGVGGDVDTGTVADAMTAAIASKNPEFLAVIGDLAYDDGKASNFWKCYRFFDSWFANARTTDGRLIPIIAGLGNHEVRRGLAANHPDFEDTPEWRLRQAPYFHRCFGFSGHGVIDFGDYLSLLVLDSGHARILADQTQWLASTLESRRERPHVIPAYHVPAYPSFRPFEDPMATKVREHWVPLFEQAGVKMAFEHHDHTFSRTKPLLGGVEHPDGIRYFGDGLWGIGSRPPDPARWYLEAANQKHHVHLVTLTPTERSVEAVDVNGEFFGGRVTQPIRPPK